MERLIRWLAQAALLIVVSWQVPAFAQTNDPSNVAPATPFVASVRPGNLGQNDSELEPVDIRLNQYIWIDVQGDISNWLGADKRSSLMPSFNGVTLSGIYPENPDVTADTNFYSRPTPVFHFRFHLTRQDDASKKAWLILLNKPVYRKQLTITLATDSGKVLDTDVTPGRQDANSRPTPASLVVIPTMAGVVSLIIILVSFAFFAFFSQFN